MYGRGWTKFIQKDIALHVMHQSEDHATMILLSKAAAEVKVKDVCGEAMKCTFIGSGLDEMRYSFRDTKGYQVIQSRDITFVDLIYGARAWVEFRNHSEPGESSYTSEGSENNGSFKDSGRLDEEDSEDGASSKEGGSKTPQVRRSTRESMALVRLPARKKASQRLWMFKVKEEHDGSKRYKARLVVKGFQQKRGEPSYVGALNDTSTHHKSEGFQLIGQKENLECGLKEIMYGLIQASRLRYLKFDSFMQKDKNLYKALVDAYESDKLILDTYGDTVSFKRCRDDEDKDEEPSTRSNRGCKGTRLQITGTSNGLKTMARYLSGDLVPKKECGVQVGLDMTNMPLGNLTIGGENDNVLYGFATNRHLDWITVHRDDDKLYKFKEDDFNRLRIQYIEDMLLLLFSDGTLNDVQTALNDRLKGIRIEYLTQTIWRQSDKDKARAMIQAIDKQLKTKRITRSLEKFIGGRPYEGDFRLLQRTI
ncbi:retrovirus-related pol polyprotein from transposon TNT 1-94 [Tanacetum coccineum]